MVDNDIIPYSDQLSQEQIKHYKPIQDFIVDFKSHNFMRRQKKKLEHVFDTMDVMALRSAKINQVYVLYRGMISDEDENSIYSDEYPSSWTTDINVVRAFCGHGYKGEKGMKKGIIMKGVFTPANILLDISYSTCSTDYEHEVLLLPGTYDIGYIRFDDINDQIDNYYPHHTKIAKNYIKYEEKLITTEIVEKTVVDKPVVIEKPVVIDKRDLPIEEMALEDVFSQLNYDDLLSEDPANKYYFSVDDYVYLAEELGIKIGKNKSKDKLVRQIIHYYSELQDKK